MDLCVAIYHKTNAVELLQTMLTIGHGLHEDTYAQTQYAQARMFSMYVFMHALVYTCACIDPSRRLVIPI